MSLKITKDLEHFAVLIEDERDQFSNTARSRKANPARKLAAPFAPLSQRPVSRGLTALRRERGGLVAKVFDQD